MGEHVHGSGTTARDPLLDGCDAYQQAKAALEILEVGLRLDAVVRTVTYVTDMADTELVARGTGRHSARCDRRRPPTRPGRRS